MFFQVYQNINRHDARYNLHILCCGPLVQKQSAPGHDPQPVLPILIPPPTCWYNIFLNVSLPMLFKSA